MAFADVDGSRWWRGASAEPVRWLFVAGVDDAVQARRWLNALLPADSITSEQQVIVAPAPLALISVLVRACSAAEASGFSLLGAAEERQVRGLVAGHDYDAWLTRRMAHRR